MAGYRRDAGSRAAPGRPQAGHNVLALSLHAVCSRGCSAVAQVRHAVGVRAAVRVVGCWVPRLGSSRQTNLMRRRGDVASISMHGLEAVGVPNPMHIMAHTPRDRPSSVALVGLCQPGSRPRAIDRRNRCTKRGGGLDTWKEERHRSLSKKSMHSGRATAPWVQMRSCSRRSESSSDGAQNVGGAM